MNSFRYIIPFHFAITYGLKNMATKRLGITKRKSGKVKYHERIGFVPEPDKGQGEAFIADI